MLAVEKGVKGLKDECLTEMTIDAVLLSHDAP